MKNVKQTKTSKKPTTRNARKLEAFKKANVALLFLTEDERACVIKAAAIVYGVTW